MLSVGLVRMFIAMSILFWAYEYIWDKKPFKYLLFIAFGMLFHISSIFMIILIVFTFKKIDIKSSWKIISLATLISTPIVFYLVSTVVVPLLGQRYQGYAVGINYFNISLNDFNILAFVLLGLYYKKYISDKFQKIFLIGIFLLVLTVIISIFGTIGMLGRLIFYTNLGLMFVLPIGYSSIPNKTWHKIIYGLIIISFCVFYLSRTQFFLEPQNANIFPYRNIYFTIGE